MSHRCSVSAVWYEGNTCSTYLQNSPYWEITAGFIGSVKASVPITTLSTDSCRANLDEILLTLKPKTLQHPSVHGISASTHLSGSSLLAADLEDQTGSQDVMTDGIMQIAGGIETIVQQLQLQVLCSFLPTHASRLLKGFCPALRTQNNGQLRISPYSCILVVLFLEHILMQTSCPEAAHAAH